MTCSQLVASLLAVPHLASDHALKTRSSSSKPLLSKLCDLSFLAIDVELSLAVWFTVIIAFTKDFSDTFFFFPALVASLSSSAAALVLLSAARCRNSTPTFSTAGTKYVAQTPPKPTSVRYSTSSNAMLVPLRACTASHAAAVSQARMHLQRA